MCVNEKSTVVLQRRHGGTLEIFMGLTLKLSGETMLLVAMLKLLKARGIWIKLMP